MNDKRLIPLSALQHYAFCRRQCALIHNEQLWDENWLTAQGQLLHQRVDSGESETRKGIRYERSVSVSAEQLGLTGKLDLVEVDLSKGEYKPVEYKRGSSKVDNWDRIQLCAQALCLEEMLRVKIKEGALWYYKTCHRESVEINAELREATLAVINKVKILFEKSSMPIAKYTVKCKSCSLFELCAPKLVAQDRSKAYVESLFW